MEDLVQPIVSAIATFCESEPGSGELMEITNNELYDLGRTIAERHDLPVRIIAVQLLDRPDAAYEYCRLRRCKIAGDTVLEPCTEQFVNESTSTAVRVLRSAHLAAALEALAEKIEVIYEPPSIQTHP